MRCVPLWKLDPLPVDHSMLRSGYLVYLNHFEVWDCMLNRISVIK